MVDEGQTKTQVPDSPVGPTKILLDVGEPQTSTPPTTINNPPSPSFFDLSYVFSSHVPPTPSPCHYIQYKPKRSVTPLSLMKDHVSSQLSSENHQFFLGSLAL